MARTKVQSELIATNAISGTIIADGAITSTHLAANCVDSSELVTGSIDTIHIAANQVTATKIVTNGVLTRHISDDQVTAAKLANSINTDIATGPAALPKAGGTVTGTVIFNSAPTFNTALTAGSSLNVATTIGIAGTTVIDGSRNLANIGTISSGAITAGTSLTVNSDANSSLTIKDGGTNAIQMVAAAGDELYIGGNNTYALRFLNDGSNSVVFDNSSKVGIGTASPSTNLTVKNNSANTSFGDNNIITLQNANTTDNSRMGLAFTGNTGIGSGLAVIDAVSYDQSHGKTSLNFSVYSGSWHNDMMVLKAGRVHIGGYTDTNHKGLTLYKSTNAAYTATGFNTESLLRLHVPNAAGNYAGITYTHAGGTEFFTGLVRPDSTADITDYVFQGYNGNSNAYQEFMRLTSSGKLVIGDSASHVDDLLQIETPASGGGHGIQIRRNDSNGDQGIGRIMFGNNNDTDLATISSVTDGQADCARLVFSTQPTSGVSTEAFRINSSQHFIYNQGDLGARYFCVNQKAGSDGGFILRVGNSNKWQNSFSSAGELQWYSYTAGATVYKLLGSGVIESPPTYSNTTSNSANMVVGSGGAFNRSTSSERYKNSITDATKGLAELKTLRPVNYKGNNDGETVFYGLIAEEVHDAGLTEFVEYNDENQPDGLRYPHMVSLCIKAIQEQQQTIEDLKARLDEAGL